MIEHPSLMEPMMPESGLAALEDRSFDLIRKASALAGQVHPLVRHAIGDLVRSMNCYYSNLIEGHKTHPRDIDRALQQEFVADPGRRNLQLEAVSHIHVQRLIDRGEDPQDPVTSVEYLQWLHREFCKRLPNDFLWVENPDTAERVAVSPGALRERTVQVGRHIPPHPDALPRFLGRFAEAYDPRRLSKPQQVIAVAAAHHRLLWIHPFIDGNGRVARLMSHAWLVRLHLGDSLWSVARGLAREVANYKKALMDADEPRANDYDGRGTLSHAALVAFCEFFLDTCIDQVDYMASLLDAAKLTDRIEQYVQEESRAGRLHAQAHPLLREALLAGEVERGRVPALTGVGPRQARNIVARLTAKRLLAADSSRAPLRLGFPPDGAERWFPLLYPPGAGG